MLKTLSIAAIVAMTSTVSFAGTLEPYVEETNVKNEGVFVPVAGSGIGAPVIIGGVVAAVVIGTLLKSDDDETATTPGTPD